MCYVIPSELNPSFPDKSKIDKFDSNYGLSSEWVKVPIHIRKNGMQDYFNLPRLIWVKKSWTLVQLHEHVFHYFRYLFKKWFKEIEEIGSSNRCRTNPEYEFQGKALNLQTLTEIFELNDQKKQFDIFFPNLTEKKLQVRPPYLLNL